MGAPEPTSRRFVAGPRVHQKQVGRGRVDRQLCISAVTGLGMDDILFRIARAIGAAKKEEKQAELQEQEVQWQP